MNRNTKNTALALAGAAFIMCSLIGTANAQDYLQGKVYYGVDPSQDPVAKQLPQGEGAGDLSPQERAAYDEAQAKAKEKIKELRTGVHDEVQHKGITSDEFGELQRRASEGDAKAIGKIAQAYQYGNGAVEKNEAAAVEWYKRAIEYGETQYYSNLGDIYRDFGIKSSGSGGVKDNNKIAVSWYQKGVQMGDPQAHLQLGVMYRDGIGVKKDAERAKYHYDLGMKLQKKATRSKQMQQEAEIYEEAVASENIVPTSIVLADHHCALKKVVGGMIEGYCGGTLSEEQAAQVEQAFKKDPGAFKGRNCAIDANVGAERAFVINCPN